MTGTSDADLKGRFFDGMSQAAATVNVVTTDGPAGRMGVTVSAMTSVSADTPKPTLLVCVHHMSPAAEAILENGAFCVNVLRDNQSYISDTFAGRRKTVDGDRFSCAEWTTQVTGAPRVVDPLVAFDCRLESSERLGTHHVFVGSVEDIFVADSGSPLIYANRSYGTPSRIAAAHSATGDGGGPLLRISCFHTFGPYIVPALLSGLLEEHPDVKLLLQEGDQRQVVESLRSGDIDVALLYDFDLGDGLSLEPMGELRPYVLLADGHPLANAKSLSVDDLSDYPLILLDAPPSRDYFLSLFEGAGYEPEIRFRSVSFEMVRGMVGHGLGYTILATKPASNMTYDGRALVSLPLESSKPPSRVVLACKETAALSPVAAAFAEKCRAFFASTLN